MATTDSEVVLATALADSLEGVWFFDPTYPDGTSVQFLYGNVGRGEGLDVESAALQFIGRTSPVFDFGQSEGQSLSLTFTIPHGPTHTAEVAGFRALVRNRRTLCYRDGRGRILWGVLTGISITDARLGTTIGTTFTTNAFTEAL